MKRFVIATTMTFSAICGTSSPAVASEQPSVAEIIKDVEMQQEATQTAVVPLSDQDDVIVPRSAGGLTPAPGGNGAYVALNVNGHGLRVGNVYVNYFPGSKIAGSNATAEAFELSWYERGQRRAETKGPDSGFLRATQKWNFNRYISAGPMCGRVKISGNWSNYACVTIKH
ncbi:MULTISPECIES: hypothetical protein [Corynebacterium]|nr:MULTISPECIES: hypothetical protein [Corynebacterium]